MAWKPCARVFLCLSLAVSVSPRVLRAHVEPMSAPEIVAASPHIVVATVEELEPPESPEPPESEPR